MSIHSQPQRCASGNVFPVRRTAPPPARGRWAPVCPRLRAANVATARAPTQRPTRATAPAAAAPVRAGAAGFVAVCTRGGGASCTAAFKAGNVGPETGWGSAMDAARWPRSGPGHAAGRAFSPGSPRVQTARPIRARPDDPRRFPRATATGHPATEPARPLPIETTSEAVGRGPRSLARCSSWPPV